MFTFVFSAVALINTITSITYTTAAQENAFSSWEISEAVLNTATHAPNANYNASFNPDCIWVFGGTSGNDFQCYNISDDTISVIDTISSSSYSVPPSSVMINGSVYYITLTGNIYKYNIETGIEELFTSVSINYGQLFKHPNEKELYVIETETSTLFYICSISNDTWTQGPSMEVTRFRPACVINEYYNDPYLYAVGGDSIILQLNELILILIIEMKLDLIIGNGKYYGLSLDVAILKGADVDYTAVDHAAAFTWNNFVFILGGTDGSVIDDIIYIDIEENEIGYAGIIPYNMRSQAVIMVNDQVFSFGGYDTSNFDVIYYSNKFTGTLKPTRVVSNQPSSIPTQYPSLQPSNNPTINIVPTDIPSNFPSIIPSTIPSTMPSNDPTKHPSNQPSIASIPTGVPSFDPTKQPTNEPSVMSTMRTSIMSTESIAISTSTSTSTGQETTDDNGQQSNKDENENDNASLNVDKSTFIASVCLIGVLLVCVIAVVMYFGTKFVQKQNEMIMAGLHSNSNSNAYGQGQDNNDKDELLSKEKDVTEGNNDGVRIDQINGAIGTTKIKSLEME